MTMQELIEWRNQEESLLRGEHPDGMSDLQDSESSGVRGGTSQCGQHRWTAGSSAWAGRSANPESEADAASIERSDPFAHMSPAELEEWRRAEEM